MCSFRQALTFTAVAFGAGIAGFAAGVLLAPASGEETRRRLARAIDDKRGDLERKGREAVERTAEKAKNAIDAGRSKMDTLLHH